LNNPNEWGSVSLIEEQQFETIENTTLSLESFGMSSSQKEISKKLLKRRLQIVWGPPVIIIHNYYT
jgi:hypothetical protein